MAEFCQLRRRQHTVWEELERRLCERDEHARVEGSAARDLQRVFRGKRVRDWLHTMDRAITTICKTFRGHRGRGVASRMRQVRLEEELLSIFNFHTIVVQRFFRGFLSRKYNHDHRRQKAYLQEVVNIGEVIRAELAAHEEQLQRQQDINAEKARNEELLAVASNLHHLIGTRTCPGIYSSPYFSEVPTIQGVPVEEHLANSAKDLLRTRGYTKRGLERDLNGTLRIPLPHAPVRRSVAASAPYDSIKKANQLENSLNDLKMLGPKRFAAGGSVPLAAYRRGVSEGSPYLEAFQNPYLVRGIPRSQAELRQPLSETTLGKFPSKPFYTSSGGGKSAVLPNGLFDVILEAQVSGGVTGRHKGKTARFGVPDTCDTWAATRLPFKPKDSKPATDYERPTAVVAQTT
jgi:hypothetical protein